MKVGVLTFHNTINYGAMLQAFALQEIIAGLGHDIGIVDYRNAAITQGEKPVKPSAKLLMNNPLSFIKALNSYPCLSKRGVNFQEFVDQYLHIDSEPVLDQVEFTRQYDALVVGSDQVWNVRLTHGDMTYFLDRIPNGRIRKVSYAASFGGSCISKEYAVAMRNGLLGFDSLSVRESSAVRLVRELCGRGAKLVLDPTLLLGRSKWEKLADISLPYSNYIFVYMVSERERTLRFAREASKKLGAKVIVIGSGNPLETKGMLIRNDASIEEFLSLIRNAALVITSSFHGLALSLAMGVNVCFSLSNRADNGNSRLESLASLLDIGNRNIACGFPDGDIDYQSVNALLDAERDKSLSFLKMALS